MAKTWFPHEDPLDDGEESQPLLGRRYSPFWLFGMAVGVGLLLMCLYVSCSFIFSNVER
jgi:hypothetical protein